MSTREEVITSLIPLVRKIARHIHRRFKAVDFDDLMGDGYVGMIRAIDSFDESFDVPIRQYAKAAIQGYMLNGMRRMDYVPERTRRAVRKGLRMRYLRAQETGAYPALDEVEAAVPGYRKALQALRELQPLSIDARVHGPYERPISDVLASKSLLPADALAADELRDELVEAIGNLRPSWREVIVKHYFGDQSLRAIAADRGLCPQRVSQLHSKSLRRLREMLEAVA